MCYYTNNLKGDKGSKVLNTVTKSTVGSFNISVWRQSQETERWV